MNKTLLNRLKKAEQHPTSRTAPELTLVIQYNTAKERDEARAKDLPNDGPLKIHHVLYGEEVTACH